ncbi:MAG: aspartate carbamoyltransferase regulatory subunit [Candidatus Diapherotrites archaeon]|nr:aspartate carbamoyltransferase regulatory subunit [Candidatus Diapherotrites archaeon]
MSLKVDVIGNGTVIDHIPGGRGLLCLKVLGIESIDSPVILLSNVSSNNKGGKKDLIKIEDRFLTPKEHNKLAIIAPGATVNIINDTHVTDKRLISVPEKFVDVICCTNPNCVSNTESYISSSFAVERKEPLEVRCSYCDRVVGAKQLLRQVIG